MDLIERKIALEILKELHGEQVMSKYFTHEQCQRTRNGILMAYNEIHSMPTVDAVPKGAYEQVRWERDMAIQQLNDYGVQLGEKADCVRVVRCKDCHFKRINSFIKGCEIAHCTLHEMGVALDDFCGYGVHEDGD